MKVRSFLVTGMLLSLAASPAQAQVYRWTDDSGRTHYSNVAPPSAEGAEKVVPGEREESAEAPPEGEAPVRREERAAEAAPPTEGPFAGMSDDVFSSVVTRKRSSLRRELTSAKQELAEATRALEAERDRKAEPTPAQEWERVVRGVNMLSSGGPPDRENELEARKEAATKRVETIRQRFGELESEAARRYGSLPSWWMPLER